MKCFDDVVQSAVKARRQRDENPNPKVFAKTMRLLACSSHGCQTTDRIPRSVTEYANDEKAQAVINNEMFKRLGHSKDQIYEVELAKSEIEQKEPIIVGFSESCSSLA